MAWVDLPAARAAADEPLDSGVTHALQARVSQLYDPGSIYDICCPADPVEQALNATSTSSTWAWIGHALPVLSRPLAGGEPRQIMVSCEVRGSTVDKWTLRAYLLPASISPTIDATDCVLDSDSYAETTIASTSYSHAVLTITTPGPTGELAGDGTVTGISVPVYWMHLAHRADSASLTVSIRSLRFREVIP